MYDYCLLDGSNHVGDRIFLSHKNSELTFNSERRLQWNITHLFIRHRNKSDELIMAGKSIVKRCQLLNEINNSDLYRKGFFIKNIYI